MAKDKLHIRPPFDLGTPMLRVARGCTHGKCRFCSIYHEPFSPVPMDEIVADIEGLALEATALTNRIFLTGGNPYALPTRILLDIFDEVEKRIPTVNSYGGFCRIADVARKSDEDLLALVRRGVNNITIGAESGCDETLAYMRKGHTAQDIAEQGKRLHEAGIEFTFFYLAGMAGAGKGQQNALDSAKAYSEASPSRILVTTLSPTKSWPLAEAIDRGEWTPSGEVEAQREIQTFIANLNCACNVNCSHDTDIIKFEGMIPEDQEKMVELLDHCIPKMNENAARRLRAMVLGRRSF
ncbi:MAG: radical SAM protein [Eggerthellaceae bacterium]|nr:radical SAM protein [Eggerthellaceae bacterium]